MNFDRFNVVAKRKRTNKNNGALKFLFILSIILFIASFGFMFASLIKDEATGKSLILPYQIWIALVVIFFVLVNALRDILDVVECINLNSEVNLECAYYDEKSEAFIFVSEEYAVECIFTKDIVGMPKYGWFGRCFIEYKTLNPMKPNQTFKMSIGYVEDKKELNKTIKDLRKGKKINSQAQQIQTSTKPAVKQVSASNKIQPSVKPKNVEVSSDVSDDDISQLGAQINSLSSLDNLLIAQGKVLKLITKYNNELESSIEEYKKYQNMEMDNETHRALMLSSIKHEIDTYKFAMDGFFKMAHRIEELIEEKKNN